MSLCPHPPEDVDRFVARYLETHNATEAYLAVSPQVARTSAAASGYEWLRRTEVKAALRARALVQAAKSEMSAQRTLEEIRRRAFGDIRQLFDESGRLLPIVALDAETASILAAAEVIRRDDGESSLHKVKLVNKMEAVRMAAQHFKLMSVNLNVEVEANWDKVSAMISDRTGLADARVSGMKVRRA